MIKAIETRYNGYRFRSRLEARWAVFFDALGIEYHYEPEGFDLGEYGYYLPDFWLPEQRIWVEIKGDEPTSNEKMKMRELANGTGKNGCIVYGQPWIVPIEIEYVPDVEAEYSVHLFVSNYQDIKRVGKDIYIIHMDHYCRFQHLWYMLWDYYNRGGKLSESPPSPDGIDVDDLPILKEVVDKLIFLDRQYWKNTGSEGDHPFWAYGDSRDGYYWADFGDCIFLDKPSSYYRFRECPVITQRLLNAYAAARSARFEHGECG